MNAFTHKTVRYVMYGLLAAIAFVAVLVGITDKNKDTYSVSGPEALSLGIGTARADTPVSTDDAGGGGDGDDAW